MLYKIVVKEIKSSLLNLRLQVSLIILLIVFAFSTIAFINNYNEQINEYNKYYQNYLDEIKTRTEDNLSSLAVEFSEYQIKPLNSGFIFNAYENRIPNTIWYNAYNVFDFYTTSLNTNPYLFVMQDINWVYILSVIVSIIILLLTYDSVSGEKELRTLAITFSNPVSRGTYLFGKLLSAILTSMLVVLPSICISLVIVIFSGSIKIDYETLLHIFLFIIGILVFVSCMASIGFLCSTLSKSSNVSMLLALAFWLFFVIVPSTSVLWADIFFPIEKSEVIDTRMREARDLLNEQAPEGSWSSDDENAFLPQHELRANIQMNLLVSDKKIRDAYINDKFNQYNKTHWITCISPIALFEYTSEAFLGVGYKRFQKIWGDLHTYQSQLLSFFKEKDANDPESPHWFNPYEDYSTTKKPVNFEEVPLFTEQPYSFSKRFVNGLIYLGILVFYSTVIFFLAFMRFFRYDVR